MNAIASRDGRMAAREIVEVLIHYPRKLGRGLQARERKEDEEAKGGSGDQ